MRYLLDIKLFILVLSLKIQGINYIPSALGLMETYFHMVFQKYTTDPLLVQTCSSGQADWKWLLYMVPCLFHSHPSAAPTIPPCRLQGSSLLSSPCRPSLCPVAAKGEASLFQSGHMQASKQARLWPVNMSIVTRAAQQTTELTDAADGDVPRREAHAAAWGESAEYTWSMHQQHRQESRNVLISESDWARPYGQANRIEH